jgi:hypothetical protein
VLKQPGARGGRASESDGQEWFRHLDRARAEGLALKTYAERNEVLEDLRRRLSVAVQHSLAQRIVVRHHIIRLTRAELP